MPDWQWIEWSAELSLRAGVLLGASYLLSFALRRQPAALRHFLWTVSLAAVVLLPLISEIAPPIRIERPRMQEATTPHPARWSEELVWEAEPPLETPTAAVTLAGSFKQAPAPRAADRLPPEALLGGLWLAGVFWFGGRLAFGNILLRRAALLPAEREDRTAKELAERLGIETPIRIMVASGRVMPMTWGWKRPSVLLPANFHLWSKERQEMTLLHELAHIRRGDWLSQTLARALGAVLWFHPMVWLAVKRMRIEADCACDDTVLAAGAKASGYAEHLVEAAHEFRNRGSRPWAALAMAQPSSLDRRVMHILDDGVARAGLRLTGRVAAAAAVLAVAIGAASVQSVAQTAPETLPAPPAPPSVAVSPQPPFEVVEPAPAPSPPEPPTPAAKPEPAIVLLAQAQPAPRPDPAVEVEIAQDALEEAREELERVRPQLAEIAEIKVRTERRNKRRVSLSPEAMRTASTALRKALGSSDENVRAEAAESLGRLGATDDATREALSAALSDENERVRRSAAEALGRLIRADDKLSAEEAIRQLRPILSSEDPRIRREGAKTLGRLKGPAAIEALTPLLDDSDADIQRVAIGSLGRLARQADAAGARAALPAFRKALAHQDSKIRRQAVEALGGLRTIPNEVVPLLAEAAEDPEPSVQREAVEALGKLSQRGSFEFEFEYGSSYSHSSGEGFAGGEAVGFGTSSGFDN